MPLTGGFHDFGVMMIRSVHPLKLSMAVLLIFAMGCGGPDATQRSPASREAAASPFVQLPSSLEGERASYCLEVSGAMDEVAVFFRSAGFDVHPRTLIDSVIVFDTTADAREYLSKQLGAALEDIPDTFSGTVVDRTLFLVSRSAYEGVWKRLYGDWPWTGRTYHKLIVHELAHRAHEAMAVAQLGSAESMGPTWFFEGLAVMCAGQFEKTEPPMTREEVEEVVGGESPPPVSYPLYGRLVRSLAAEFGIKTLISRASEIGFPGTLWSAPAANGG